MLLLVGLWAAGTVWAAEPGGTGRTARTPPRPAGSATAQVEFVQGAAVRIAPPPPRLPKARKGAPAAPEAAALAAGDAVSEGTRIQVPKDGYLRLRLADGSIVRVLAESDVELKRLRNRRPSGPYESVIDVKRGKVESDVSPQPKGRRFEIHAPGAVASVRGTRFDVSVDPAGRVSTAVSEGVVKVLPRKPGRRGPRSADVQAGHGVVVAADGQLDRRKELPAPPDLEALPRVFHDAGPLVLQLPRLTPSLRGYEVSIASDPEMTQVVRNGFFPGERAQFPALADGNYWLGVRAVDTDGLAGAESRATIQRHAHPVPPLYQSPAPGARITSDAGELVCSEVADAGGVHVQVASSRDFVHPALDETHGSGCRFGVMALTPGDYWWRVASIAAADGASPRHGPWAAPQPFTVAATPSVLGVELDERSENPTLRWQAEPGQTFRAQVARNGDFDAPLQDVALDTPAWTLQGLPRGSYQVRLQARDASGLVGPFSPPRLVRVGPVVGIGNGGTLRSADGLLVDRP